MVRFPVTLACLLGAPLLPLLAQEQPQPEGKQPETASDAAAKGAQQPLKAGKKEKETETDSLKNAVRSLSHDQKQRVQENIKTWKQLGPDQQEALRQRENVLRKQVAEEIEPLVKDLTPEQREAFTHRYMEERRKLQLALRQEMEARRKAAVSELQKRLKQETPETDAAPKNNLPASNPTGNP
ncbi:MAG: hypothetical protein WCO60_07565 [Verrucomicrobiota bacterium]